MTIRTGDSEELRKARGAFFTPPAIADYLAQPDLLSSPENKFTLTPRADERESAPSCRKSGTLGALPSANRMPKARLFAMGKRHRRSEGTRGVGHLVSHPAEMFKDPSTLRAANDLSALEAGERLEVTCFLRGWVPGFPSRVRQGTLLLEGRSAEWRRYWSFRREPLTLPRVTLFAGAREPGVHERNVKRGGRAYGVLVIPAWTVLAFGTDEGNLELTVTEIDAPLVRAALTEI